MGLTNLPALLAPLAPAKRGDLEAIKAWASDISNFLGALALSLEETVDATITDSSQITDGTVTTDKLAANAVTLETLVSAGPTTITSAETSLVNLVLSAASGRAQLFGSVLLDNSSLLSIVTTIRMRKDSLTGTILRTVTVTPYTLTQVGHSFWTTDATPATSQTYVLSGQAAGSTSLSAVTADLLATNFKR